MAISNDLEETHQIAIDVLRYHPLEVEEEPFVSLESPLSLPDVSIPAHSSQPETTIPSILTLVESSIPLDLPFFPHVTSIQTFSPPSPPPLPSPSQPSISLDAPPPVTESIAPLPVTESIAPPLVTESIAPLHFLEGTAHAARLHVRVPEDIELHVYNEFYLCQFHLT
ncbi:hypothetical protein CK203_004948 [Vitis vinifera]|uniref:Uncharacterized protein n=1 Tax=Vitis vinifera TaxID=29760 RepID=A0A438KED3_VITVI|nr:hypothetical protein CK203_004948 [Vitis vinifera]